MKGFVQAIESPPRSSRRVPRHIGFIPDGNRRWAVQQGLRKDQGYAQGIAPGLALFEACKSLGVEEVSVFGEQRSFIVGLPASYEFSDTRYPVLYLLDGSQHFHYTTGITTFLSANQFIPQMIVIAVNNTDRRRDLTPPSQVPAEQQSMPTHGGADNFRRFLADELIPWVDQKYRTHPYKVLSGHSLGGLFAVHTLATQPDLFNAYIAISPSMQWNAQHLVKQAEQYFSSTRRL